MIRINLIATAKGGKRRSRGSMPDVPNVGVLLFVLLLVIEGAVLYSMFTSASEQAQQFSSQLRRVEMDLKTAKKTHAELGSVRKEVGRLQSQALLFEELKAEKKGPVGALTYLSFILKPRDQATHEADELKQMEAAGWRVGWDATRAWFTYLHQAQGEVTLRGAAVHHDDVAEVVRRLESSAHFRNVKLVWQERRRNGDLGRAYIAFTLKSDLLYLVEPYLTAEQRAQKEAAAAEKKAAAAEKEEGGQDSALPELPSAKAPPSDRPAGADSKPAVAAAKSAALPPPATADGGKIAADAATAKEVP
ncbi:MAG: PilN domain-containing protein [Myxococcales bacterium]|nr:PilN domain-containing protein [Myxococcales bacterium]